MSAGPGGGHEHIHCTLRLLDASQVPQQILGRGADGGDQGDDEREPPLAVVSAKYYFNGDANVVFRYRLYSFHACPVRPCPCKNRGVAAEGATDGRGRAGGVTP